MIKRIKYLQSGRSMIEMLGVLAIVGVLSAAGIAGYSMAMYQYKTNDLIDKVQYISHQTRIVYEGKYKDASHGTMLNLGFIEDNVNPFGGHLAVAQVGNGEYFTIKTEATVPDDVCVKLLTHLWADKGLLGVNTSVTTVATTSMNIAQVAKKCNSLNNVVVWTFK